MGLESNRLLVYILHSGNLYGTEKMALATLEDFQKDYHPVLLTPPGIVVEEAQRRRLTVYIFENLWQLGFLLRRLLMQYVDVTVMSTGVRYSMLLWMENLWYQRWLRHLHMVHGGADEWQSYGRKRFLNCFNLRFVVNSNYVRNRLLFYGVHKRKIVLIENFIPERYLQASPRRLPFTPTDKLQQIVVVSRLDPLKKVDLLLDSLAYEPKLQKLNFKIFGTGQQLSKLKRQARQAGYNITFRGFVAEIAQELAKADLLVHLCPTEPFGLAILEAMAANIPVLVPDKGGVAKLVEPGKTGFQFHADDKVDLARQLEYLTTLSPMVFNEIVQAARQQLQTRFSSRHCIAQYRAMLDSFRYSN